MMAILLFQRRMRNQEGTAERWRAEIWLGRKIDWQGAICLSNIQPCDIHPLLLSAVLVAALCLPGDGFKAIFLGHLCQQWKLILSRDDHAPGLLDGDGECGRLDYLQFRLDGYNHFAR